MKTYAFEPKRQALPSLQEPWHYDHFATVLHALALLLIIATGVLGVMLHDKHASTAANQIFNLHMSFGVLIGLMIFARMVWHMTHPPRTLPDYIPRWQMKSAAVTLWLLCVLLVLVPLAGYLGARHTDVGAQLFGWTIAQRSGGNAQTAAIWFALHTVLVWSLALVLVVHCAGAIKHWFYENGTTFNRMLFKGKL